MKKDLERYDKIVKGELAVCCLSFYLLLVVCQGWTK